jgi:hypothetical protein
MPMRSWIADRIRCLKPRFGLCAQAHKRYLGCKQKLRHAVTTWAWKMLDRVFNGLEPDLDRSLPCAAQKIPFSFEVERYNGQPANNRLTFVYVLSPDRINQCRRSVELARRLEFSIPVSSLVKLVKLLKIVGTRTSHFGCCVCPGGIGNGELSGAVRFCLYQESK